MRLPLRRFTVSDLATMRRTGILPPRARIELLEGILVDLPRPSARELEVIQNLIDVFARHLGDASVVPGEPIHPEAYAVFDPTIMVHEWDKLALSEPYPLHRFSVEEYHRLVEVGVLPESSGHQLMDGVVLAARPRSPHIQRLIGRLVSRISAVSAVAPGVTIRCGEPVRLGPYSLVRPAITLCRGPSDRRRSGPLTGEDVIVTIDIRDRRNVARHVSWPVYARWGVGIAWLVETGKGIDVASEPSHHGFTRVERCTRGQRIALPPPLAAVAIAVDEICPTRGA